MENTLNDVEVCVVLLHLGINHRYLMDAAYLTVRRAAVPDAPAMAQVLLSAFESFRPLYTDGGFAATTPTAETIVQRFEEGPAWVAVVGDEVCGSVSAVVKGTRLYIRSMAVSPSTRGLGVGSALLREVERFASEQQVQSMYLSTTPFLHSAIRLYERFGFTRTGEEPSELFGTPLFTMEKLLNRHRSVSSAG